MTHLTQSPPQIISNVPSTSSSMSTRPTTTDTVRRVEPRVPESLASIQQSNVIYQRHLELKGHGFPLWVPPANQNLSIQYRRTGVRIGDVGIITTNGGFSFLFNICLPHNDPVNLRSLPEHFSPISAAADVDKFPVFGHGSHLASASVENANCQSLGLQFESSASEGAILAMPLGATSESLGNVASFRRYMASNMVHWYKYVNGVLGREVNNGDIRLVVGCVKTTSWGIATFANHSHQSSCHLRFAPLEVPSPNSISSNGSRYVWDYRGIADVRAGPSPGENSGLKPVDDSSDVAYENQCLFLRTLNATLPDNVWSEIHCDPGSPEIQLRGNLHPAKPMASSSDRPSSAKERRKSNRLMRRSLDPHSGSRNNTMPDVLDSGPLPSLTTHPANALNDALMAMAPAARMVITHDDDWSSVVSEYDTIPDPHELLEQILVSHHICKEDGIIFLARREAIESDGSSGAKTAPNSSLTSVDYFSSAHESFSLASTSDSKPNILDDIDIANSPIMINPSASPLILSDNVLPFSRSGPSGSPLYSTPHARQYSGQSQASQLVGHPPSELSDSANSLEISDITIKSSMTIASVKLSIGSTFQYTVARSTEKSKEVTVPLVPPGPSLPSSTPLIIKVILEGVFHRSRNFEIERQQLLSDAGTVDVDTNKREYRRSINGVEVVVGFALPQAPWTPESFKNIDRPTTDRIFDICPRFRVLVIGRTGAGKTSLIMNTFGVTDAFISHDEVGECDINKELCSSDENKRFVLHDSKGFEPGDKDNFDTVMKFLNDRKRKPQVSDQVHAVWLCFSIPIAGDRLLEKGTEKFLQSLREGELDGLPIIAIFTKFDRLVNHIRVSGRFPGLVGKDLQENIYNEANAMMNELCFEPFREQIVGMTRIIPEIAVSSKEEYKWTLHDLTRLTTECVGKYLSEDVAVLSAVAQQVNPTVKLEAVIAVGKKQYWKGLASTIKLPGRLKIVLQNIHQDIVSIWNMQDPNKFLDSEEFKELVAAIVVNERENALSKKEITTTLTMLGTLAAVISSVALPLAPIVIPIAVTFVVGHWAVLLFKQSSINLHQLMNYIVALTFIMQIIFAITTSTNNVISRRSIKLALRVFHDSPQKDAIQSAIKQHLERTGAQFHRDAALVKITDLIYSNGLTPADMAKIKTLVKDFDVERDEPWVVDS